MRSIRHILLASVLSVSAFSAMTLTSCKKDDESCPVGYEGSDCKTESRTKFAKTWSCHWVNVADATKNGDYTCTIYATPTTVTQVVIDKTFFESLFNNNINATLTDANSISIPTQTPDGSINPSIQGSGTYSGGQIVWSYSVTSNGVTKSYTDTWK